MEHYGAATRALLRPRYAAQRLRGRPVTFITGTDEHGEKIALAAAKRGMEPKAHCDDIVASYKALWRDVSEPIWPQGGRRGVCGAWQGSAEEPRCSRRVLQGAGFPGAAIEAVWAGVGRPPHCKMP